MRKAILGSMLAVALLAMLGVVVPTSRVHAASLTPSASCASTYWQFNTDETVSGQVGNNGWSYDFQLYMLRDSSTSAYCGKVYTKVGVYVPKSGTIPSWFKIWFDNYPNGNFVNEQTIYYNDTNSCYTHGPCWLGSSGYAFSVSSGSFVTVKARIQNDQGSWPSAGNLRFYI